MPDVVETLQHGTAFRSLLKRRARPIDLVATLELHEEVFRGSPAKRPGQWRLSNPYIAGTSYLPPRRERVVAEMEAWAAESARRLRGARSDRFASAAWMHHRFEQIHPFEDGNGRTGRPLLNLFLMKAGWPPVHVLPFDRTVYLDSLEAANLGDLRPLEAFLRIAMARGLLDLLDQVGGPDDALVDVGELAQQPWMGHKAAYLTLRCRQGVIPAIRVGETSGPVAPRRGRPRWLTSMAGLRLGLRV